MIKRILFFTLLLSVWNLSTKAQTVMEHQSNEGIYSFLDEMANQGFIEVHSTVKPWSREYIGQKLQEAAGSIMHMPFRMYSEWKFYIKAYSPELKDAYKLSIQKEIKGGVFGLSAACPGFYYSDSLLRFQLRPIAGYEATMNKDGSAKHRWWGAEGFAYMGDQLGIYTSLRDNNESERMTSKDYFVQTTGVPAKNFGDKGFDYSEMRGGIIYSWKWGYLGLIKDHVSWGDNYHGSIILSGRTPSFAHIALKLKPASWIELNYIHGWLVSSVVDSTRSYYDDYVYRSVYRDKFIAANMITIKPLKGLSVSAGNSVIYSGMGVHAAYLNPIMFYKSVDHTLNNTNSDGESGQNAQMFINISSRQIRHLHLYGSLFFDELNISRIKKGLTHNFYSLKAGVRESGYLLPNLTLTAEYTMTKPLVYAHKISTTTFESNQYNLGHYLRDNSREYYFEAVYKPYRGVRLTASYTLAVHYNDYVYDNSLSILDDEAFKDKTWQNSSFRFRAGWELLANAGIYLEASLSETKGFDADGKTGDYYLNKYTPRFLQGKNTLFNTGFYIGW